MLKKIRNSLFIFLIFIGGIGHAQQYNLKQYGTKDGLVNSIVKTIFIDSKGFLWFGTQGGVSRFDGKQFKNFTIKDGLPGNDITSITEDLSGNIWIGTYGFGVAKFDGQQFTNFGEKDGLPNLSVYSIICDKTGELWITTLGGGLCKYEPKGASDKKFTIYSTKTGLATDQLFKGNKGSGGNIWFGTRGKGVYRYDGKNFVNYTTADGLTAPSYFSTMTDSKGRTWLGSIGKGIDIISSDYSISHLALPEIEGDLISNIVEDRKGNYWIAAKQGLLKYNDKGRMLFTDKEGLPSNLIYAICEDYEGNMWIGTSSGVCMFKNEAIVAYGEKEGILKKSVTAYFCDSHGNCLVGMAGGGAGILKNNFVTPLSIKELEGQTVLTFAEDSVGNIWIGCDNNDVGVVVISNAGGTWKTVRTIPEIEHYPVQTVIQIIRDSHNNMWMASYGAGIFCIRPNGSTKLLNDSNGLPTNNMLSLHEDKKGNIWFGTYQAGVVKYDVAGKLTIYTEEKDGLADNSVWCIAENEQGNLFFGTNDNGISCFDGNKFVTISTSQGLCSDLVYALIVDQEKRLWVGTDKGVNRLSLDPSFKIVAMKFYGEKEGIRGTEINQNSFYIDNNQMLWMGTNNGLMRYNPSYDYINDNPPRLQLNGIRLNYQVVDWTKYTDSVDPRTKLPVNPVLSYKENHLTFDFQALTTDNVQYQFMLEGLDDVWAPLTTTTSAAYTNLPSGRTYTFKVRAINSDGFSSKNNISYTFTINPPFWQTWWFYSLATVFSLVLVFGFIRSRTARLEKEKKVLEEKVDERTKELQFANGKLSASYKDITDSINYANRIQQAILPPKSELDKSLSDYFIFFRPRDVVSGDFYWLFQKGNKTFIAAVDCTGHGVPGAFMSIIGNSLLNEIMNETNLEKPADIMNLLRDKLITALRQQGNENESKDGMDMALCCIDREKNLVTFAGANNPLYHISDGQLNEYKADKFPIGVFYNDLLKPFTHKEVPVKPGDVIYIFSDGYPDQFGGPSGKKFLYKQFKQQLLEIHNKPMTEQGVILGHTFDTWKLEYEQVDDVLVIGVRI